MSKPRPPEPSSLPLETRLDYSDGQDLGRIPPAPAVWALAAFALVLALASWTPILHWLSWIDLPVNVLIFLVSAWISLADLRETWRALPGLVLSAAAVSVSALHLVFDRTHPWAV